jgi:NDP-sugar pyrophosphorylase family protein
MSVQTAGIIAAGDGMRFREAGFQTLKPLIPVAGVPLIRRCLELLQAAGIQTVHCIINEASSAVQDYVESLGLELGVHFVKKSTPSSMHSLFELAPYLKKSERFLLTTIDSIASVPEFRAFVDAAGAESEADGVLACTGFVQDEKPLWIAVDDRHRILRFAPPPAEASCVTGGYYVLRSTIFDEMEPALRRGMQRLRNFLAELLDAGFVLRGYHFSQIVDVDDPLDLVEAERLLERLREAYQSV